MQRVLKIHKAATYLNDRGWLGRKVAGVLWSVNHLMYSCEIGIGAKIDPSCVFYHSALGVVIHSNVEIGKRCKVFQHVTIGSSWRGGENPGAGVPRIGNDVLLGAGCVLIGDIEVGDGAIIGANAVVTESVPEGSTAVGVPARII